MVQKVQGVQDGEFLISEAAGHRSREQGVVISGQNLAAGTLVEDSGGKYTAYTAAANPAIGILWGAVDATDGDAPGVIIVRDAEVDSNLLTGWDAGADADLPTIFDRGA